MIPILYEQTETAFTSNGIGRLSDIISCTVTEERNGIYECQFEYPITGIHYNDITEGRVIACIHDDSGTIEPYDIYSRSAPINGVVTFYAHHISYRLTNVVVDPFTATSAADAFIQLKNHSINDNPFSFSTDKVVSALFKVSVPSSIRELLCGSEGSVLDVYGTGEYEFSRYNVKLWLHRGTDTGVEIRYGKNLINIDKDYDISGTYDAVIPFWYSEESRTLITAPDYIVYSSEYIPVSSAWTDENGTVIEDENGTDIDFFTRLIKPLPMDLTNEFEEQPTPEQVRDLALSKIDKAETWLPDENIKVNFVALWQTPEYENIAPLQRVKLCDTVNVYFEELGVHAENIKVVKVVYNVLNECYDEIELGKIQSSFAETVQSATIDKITKDVPSKGFLEASIKQATDLLTGGLGGYVVFNRNADGEPQELLIMDTDNINTAVNVIRINKNGIGFSQNGYNGPFSSAWTIDNTLDMENINVINLTANAIKAGTLRALTGDSYWNLNTGLINSSSSYNSASKIQIQGSMLKSIYNDKFLRIQSSQLSFFTDDGSINGLSHAHIQVEDNSGTKTLQIKPGSDLEYISLYSSAIQKALSINCNPDVTGRDEAIIVHQYIAFGQTLLPSFDDGTSIGNADKRFLSIWARYLRFTNDAYIYYNSSGDYIYSSKSITQASDERLKNIYDYDERYDNLIDFLEPIVYTWKDNPGRRFVGLGARRTAALLEECGIDNAGFVGIGEDENGDDVYSVDYQELSVMLLHKVQKQQEEINDLKKQIFEVLERLEAV